MDLLLYKMKWGFQQRYLTYKYLQLVQGYHIKAFKEIASKFSSIFESIDAIMDNNNDGEF